MGAGTFARSHTFVSGETLTAVLQNGIETNIINNFNFSGLDDYSSSLAEMRTTTDPYPASAESQPTDGKGELERMRYIIAQLTGRTYWYQDVYPIMGEGADIASATTTDIWAAYDGATKHITGTTTITSFGTAPQAGSWMKVIFDGILTLTHGANLNLPGSANITTAANDFAFVYADTTTLFRVLYFRANGKAYGQAYRTATYNFAATNTFYDIPLNAGNNNLKNVTHSTVTNPERVTVSIGGVYRITYSVATHVATTQYHVKARLVVNAGNTEIAGSASSVSAGGGASSSFDDTAGATIIVTLAANDYVKIQAGSGSTTMELNIYDDGSLPDFSSPTTAIMTIEKIDD